MEEGFLKALEKNDLDRAEEILENMKEKLPRTRFLYLEGLVYEKMGDLKEALKKFDMALVLHLSDHTLWMAKARTLLELESLDMAKRAAERACRLKNEDPDAHLLLSEILYRMKEYPNAEKEIDSSLNIGKKSAPALTLKGILVSINKQDYRLALTYFDSAIDTDEFYGRAWTNRGIALKEIGDRDGAVFSFQKGLLINPGDKNARKMLVKMGHKSFVRSTKENGSMPEEDEWNETDEGDEQSDDDLEEMDEWEEWGDQ